MKLPIIGILSGVALATLGISSAAQAAILLPSLPPGSQYRLVFVTSGTRDATSTNIADYNQFVNNAAQASTNLNTALTTAGLTPSAINWTAIGSTATVNARLNTATRSTDPSVPIYRVDGAQVATDTLYNGAVVEIANNNLWSGSIMVQLNISEQGDILIPTPFAATGTLNDGPTDLFHPLGALGGGANVLVGTTGSNGGGWVQSQLNPYGIERAFYGISSIVTVPTATATPEPSSLLSFITLGGLILGGAVRGVRK